MSISSQNQEDSSSTNSRSSMEFLSSPMDSKERLGHIDSAIRWIKDELAGMRDRDKTILQYLSHAQTCIKSIQQQQQKSMKVQSDVERRHLFGSTEDLNKTQQTMGTAQSDKYGTLAANMAKSFISSGALCTSPDMLTPVTLNADDELLSSFLGEGNTTTASKSAHFLFEFNDPNNTKEKEKKDKQEDRKSAVSELQLLRKQLQQETKQDLEKFDKKFDTPKLLEIDEGKTSYRYSILNRMEELLNHKLEFEGSGHIRQSSEPSMKGSVSEWGLSSSKKTHQQKSDFHSFRYSSKPPMTRSDSAGVPKSAAKMRSGAGVGGTHYDTTVIGKRRSRPSSRTSTLERQQHKHPLHHSSIDSLSSSEPNFSDPESPEHTVDKSSAAAVAGRKHRVAPLESVSPRHSSLDNGNSSPEIHPELSPLSPLLSHIDSYMMTTSQSFGFGGKGSVSAPLSRKMNGFASNDTWL